MGRNFVKINALEYCMEKEALDTNERMKQRGYIKISC